MNTNIKATNIELTSAISDYVNKCLSGVEKFIKEGEEAIVQVEVGKTTKHHKQGDFFRAEFNIEISGSKFYSFSEREDLYIAIDEAREEVVRQIKTRKEKKQTLFKRGSSRIKNIIKGLSDRNPFGSK